jgi:hypothetical protein
MYRLLTAAFLLLATIFLPTLPKAEADESSQSDVVDHALGLLAGERAERLDALNWFRQRGRTDAISAILDAVRFTDQDRAAYLRVVAELAAEPDITSWNRGMLWQEAHPEIPSLPGYDRFKTESMGLIDPHFRDFLAPGVKHEIRLEEIAWGGVLKDGIPALINPAFVSATSVTWLGEGELVFGVAINGDVRAYPFRIMDWHEMADDVVGGVPVALAYCTLCGSGILFDTRVPGRENPFVFGSSGFLYRSNKLMYDRETNSLWNQFTGRPVVGRLTGSGIQLKILPIVITSWGEWRSRHPDTKVLSLETGYQRPYIPGLPYGEYFASPELMFPAVLRDRRLQAKDHVFGIRTEEGAKAWPIAVFKEHPVINDSIGSLDIVLIGDESARTVRAYERQSRVFTAGADAESVASDGKTWRITEDGLIGPEGQTMPRLAGHVAYWFAWASYFPEAELYQP